MSEEEKILEELEELRARHRALDEDVSAMQASANADQLRIARLKKQKLALRDRIQFLEDQLTPDIIA